MASRIFILFLVILVVFSTFNYLNLDLVSNDRKNEKCPDDRPIFSPCQILRHRILRHQMLRQNDVKRQISFIFFQFFESAKMGYIMQVFGSS